MSSKCPHCGKEITGECKHEYVYQDAEGNWRCARCLSIVRDNYAQDITYISMPYIRYGSING
jgi:hypothetical protein